MRARVTQREAALVGEAERVPRLRMTPLRLDQAAPDGVAGQGHAVAQPELLQDVAAVALHRLLADVKDVADLAAGETFGDELDDLGLARRQRVAVLAVAAALEEVGDERGDAGRMQERLAAHRGAAG